MTRPYAEVIGDPIAHSKSPLIHNFWLEKLEINAEYRACHVKPGELADYFASRRKDPEWRGCNVTIPHKEKVANLLDSVEPNASKIGAVNTIFTHRDDGLCGINTDVDGVGEALQGLALANRRAVVIGAGGAARSAFAHLEGLGCSAVQVVVRNPHKAEAVLRDFNLTAQFHPIDGASAALEGAALVINATQLGMEGQSSMPRPILDAISSMATDSTVFDMVYAPLHTDLLGTAGKLGFGTVDGLAMLIGQARTAFARFFGEAPSSQYDVELRRLLTA